MTRLSPFRLCITCAVLLASTWGIHAEDVEFKEGKHYFLLPDKLTEAEEAADVKSNDEIEVIEFFSYSCPACLNIEGFIKNWEQRKSKDVVFRREHVIFSASSIPLARAYYLAEDLKVLSKIHDKIFEAIHRHDINLAANEELIMSLFRNAAKVDNDTFKEKYWAKETQDRIRAGNRKVTTWRISATPTFVVGEKYVVTTDSAGRNPRRMFQIIDYLADKIRAASKETKPIEST